eukprot:s935_g19.t1
MSSRHAPEPKERVYRAAASIDAAMRLTKRPQRPAMTVLRDPRTAGSLKSPGKLQGIWGLEDFVSKLPEGEPRYALVDYEYTSEDGRPQSKLCFVFWTTVKDRMVYASSKDALKKKFPGIMKEVQANDMGDLDVKEVDDLMKKK